MKKLRKTWLLPVVVLLLLAGGGVYYFKTQKTARTDQAATSTVTVTRGDIEDVVTSQGKLEPRDFVDVGTQVSGQLKTLHVAIGDTVKKGDLLAEIDPEVYESKVEADLASIKTLQAQVQQQNAQIELAKQQNQRNLDLFKVKAISEDALQTTESQLKVAQAQLSALQAQIQQQQSALDGDRANLGYTKIYAPMDGTVVSQTTKQGQTVNASQSAPVIVQLANLDIMTVRAQVAEADVMRLKTGMPVYFTTLGGTRKWNAAVRQILPTPQTVNDVVLYDVLVDVDNTDRQLMQGMSTQMFFVVAKAENVLTIPVAALGRHLAKQDNETGQAYRVTLPGKTEPSIIRIGLMDRTNAEVKSGLNEGDTVIIAAAPVKKDAAQGGQRRMGGPGGGGPRL
jgi:macrolide-specific efflux system membrane fusion protein